MPRLEELYKGILDEESYRSDGTKKGLGYFGLLLRPDMKFSTEFSTGVSLDGRETQIPLLVPTLSHKEIGYLLQGNRPNFDILQKAIRHALKRMDEGKNPFAQEGEQEYPTKLFYDTGEY